MTWVAGALIAVVLLGTLGGNFLYFIFPSLAEWLMLAGLFSVLPLLFFLVAALLRWRWKLLVVCVLACMVASLYSLGLGAPLDWLRAQGFHLNTVLAGNYPSRCEMTEFVEKGVQQRVGNCWSHGADDFSYFVVYDTTGEFALPPAQRTPEWRAAMSKAVPPLAVAKRRAHHLFGDYYSVLVELVDFQ